MIKKICSIGNSHGITIPKEILKKAHLTSGSTVEIKLDEKNNKIIIEPSYKQTEYENLDFEFASHVKDFITQYKPALKALAKK